MNEKELGRRRNRSRGRRNSREGRGEERRNSRERRKSRGGEKKRVGGRDGLEEWETVGMRNGPLKLGKNETDNRHSIAVPRDTRFSLVF